MLDMPVGKLFVQHFFDRERAMSKVKNSFYPNCVVFQMRELTRYLKEEFIKQLHILDWMDEATRKRAINKAGMIEYKSGYPEVLFNDTWMDKHWGMVSDKKVNLLTILFRISPTRNFYSIQPLD